MKKVLAMLLVLVMVIGMMPLHIFAAETPTVTLTPSATELNVGDTFTVSVDMAGNTGLASVTMQLLWNADVVSLEGMDYTNTITPNPTVNEAKGAFVWYALADMTANGNLFVATFKVLKSGDCGIAVNKDNFVMSNAAAEELTPVLDESAVSGLTVAEPHVCVYVDIVLKEATCTVDGVLQHLCEGCGDQSVETIPALGHDFAEGTCTRCGAADPDYEAPHEHSYEAVITAPTCTAGGYTTYTCACGDTYTADETEALGHNYVNGACKVCGEANPEAVTYAWYGDGTFTAYTISTAEELAQLAAIVNGTDANYPRDNFAEKLITLANDIALASDGLYTTIENVSYGTSGWPYNGTQVVLNAKAPVWTPIGTSTASGNKVSDFTNAFAGTFDGNGHTISGVYTGTKDATAANTASVQGLFGVVSGTVKNLTVSGCVTGSTVVGGIVAYLNGGTIENCVNNAVVMGDGGNKPASGKEEGGYGYGAVGGITGRAAGTASVTFCVNNALVACNNSNLGGRVAGIIGLIDSRADAVTVYANANHGQIEGYHYTAGIVGMNYSTQSPVDSCFNTGHIIGGGGQKQHAAGIVGQYASDITNCYNTGMISITFNGQSYYWGGIGGDFEYSGSDAKIYNSYNLGIMTHVNTRVKAGMICAEGKIYDCFYLDEALANSGAQVSGNSVSNPGTATSKTAEEMKSAQMVALLNGENGTAWKADGNCVSVNNGYPVLAWQDCADHDWADATCTTPKTCTVCGATEGEALGHNYQAVVTAPTCTEGGYTTHTCANCGDSYITDETAATGHTWIGGTCAVCGVSNENAEKYPWYEAGRETASYTISTAEELAQFAAIVNGTDANYPLDNFSGKTVSLANDIALAADGLYVDCGEKTFGASSYPLKAHQYVLAEEAPVWTPIGTGTATSNYNNVTVNTAFAGTFDGKGHTVSGVYTGTKNAAAPNTATVQGLFGIVTGTVKNLTVSGCVTGRSVVGGVVAYLNGGTIENCVNNAIVFADGGNKIGSETGGSGAGATGGIVGRAGGTAAVTDCVNNATVICANSNKGGRVAGIIGLIDSGSDVVTIVRNANYGDVTGYQYVAGIVGLNYSKNSPINSCLNTGDIHAWGAQKLHVGGIVGQFDSPVADCYVTGDVYTYWTARTAYVGGVAGDRTTFSGTAGNALTVNNCYFTGSIIYVTNDGIASMGMIAGDVSANSVNNYYLDEGFAASSSHKGAVNTSYATSRTADEMKSEAQVALLNGASEAQVALMSDEEGAEWKMDGNCISVNDGYPILVWQTDAADHDWADATCTAPKTCAVCGETEGEALGHSYEAFVTDPTCTEQGYTTHTCSVCGDSYVDTYVEALGHSYEAFVTDPTCTEQGCTTHTCSVCGDSYVDAYVDALGHDYQVTEIVKPTCTEAGHEVYTCSACGDSHTEELEALGHNYQDGVCTGCGEEDPAYEEPSVKPTQPDSDNDSPKTGDSAQLMLWTGLMVMVLFSMVMLFVTRKKWMKK